MAPGERFTQWVVDHYDPLVWTFIAFAVLLLMGISYVVGFQAGWRARRREDSRPVYSPEELGE